MKKLIIVAFAVIGFLSFWNIAHVNAATPAAHTESAVVQATDETDHSMTSGDTETGEVHITEGDHTEEEPGVVGMFGVNWKLFIAQLINFGIILFVLWKWVFGPVAKGLADRTTKIENSLKEAQKITEERQTFESWKQGEIATVRQEASGIITQAKQEAEAVKQNMVEQTKQEQMRITEQTKAQLEREKTEALQQIKGEIAGLVVHATQTILSEKLDASKDKELIKKAIGKATQ